MTDDSRQPGRYPQQRALSSSSTPCHRRLTSTKALPSTEGTLQQQYALSQTTHVNQGVTLNRGRSPAAVRPVTDDSRQPGCYPQQRALSSSSTPCHRRLTSTRALPSTEGALQQQYALSQTTHVNQGVTLNRGRSPAAVRPVTDNSRQPGRYPQQRALSSSSTPCHRRLTSTRALPSTEGALQQQYALSQTTHNLNLNLYCIKSPQVAAPVGDADNVRFAIHYSEITNLHDLCYKAREYGRLGRIL